jgi:Arc/MetJ-type ribon-helix-helix transcriptional regulator
MKVSVSIPDDDVQFLDDYATEHGVASRSAVVQRALSLLRAVELGDDYAAAWADWDDADGPAWDAAVADGMGKASG